MTANIESFSTDHSDENFILLWIDPSVNSDENSDAQQKLASIHTNFKTFTSKVEGKKAIEEHHISDRIILIISGGFGSELIPQIHSLEQVVAIYIFCINQSIHAEWAKQFNKIKAVIVDLNKLVSMIEKDHETFLKEKRKALIAIPNVNAFSGTDSTANHTSENVDIVINETNNVFQYSLRDLVNAGELLYADKTIDDIAKDIVKKFQDDPCHDFKHLITDIIQPVMYLLKRRQNLTIFFDVVKNDLLDIANASNVSQRLIIDTIMMNSNGILRRHLMSLLNKHNPIPFLQPQTDLTQNKYRSVVNIIHLWDYHRPILLSFGIGPCEGKTSLINCLFGSDFEESMNDSYFKGTIDIDFMPQRPIHIADTHNEISLETLHQISVLFHGFLVHVEKTHLCSNLKDIIDYLTSLPQQGYVQLIVRDVTSEAETKLKSSIDDIRTACPNCQIYCLMNVIDKSSRSNKAKINKLREIIFQHAVQLPLFDETLVQTRLENLLNPTEKQIYAQERAFINRIQSVLINGTLADYPLYSLFVDVCQKRSAIARIDPYEKKFESDKLFQLNDELFQADSAFKSKQREGPDNYGDGFKYFFELIENQNLCSTYLHLLAIELDRRRDNVQFSLDIHWRNVIIGSNSLSHDKQQILINAYRDYIAEGNPFEIVDGDNFEMQGDFLIKVFQLFPDKKFFVISVIGPQNSGKSTLLNFLFGASFEARNGRCTKGVYGTLVNVQSMTDENKLIPRDYDYILIIDTEGLLSAQKADEQYDKSLILFCLAVSHLVIVNVEGEINHPVNKCFLLCTQALKYLGETRVCRPTIYYVLNKRTELDRNQCKELIESIRRPLQERGLDKIINLEEDNFHMLPVAFQLKPFDDTSVKWVPLQTLPTFVTDVQKLCRILIDASSDIIQKTGDTFCVPTNWINFANRVLRTIKKHPSLTYFQDIFECKQYEDIREDIRQDFDEYLSPVAARFLIDKEKENDSERIRGAFNLEYDRLLKILVGELERHFNKHEATENIRERTKQLMEVQLLNILRSWEVTTIMKSEQCKNSQIGREIDQQLRQKAISITHKDHILNCEQAKIFFEKIFDEFVAQKVIDGFKSEFQWTQCITLVSRLCDVLNIDNMPSIANFMEYVSFLQSLDPSVEQPISINDCLSKIRHEFVLRTSNVEPFISSAVDKYLIISTANIQQQYTYLNSDQLRKVYSELQANGQPTRQTFKHGLRQYYSKPFLEHWKQIVQISTCFERLTSKIEEKFMEKNVDNLPTELQFVQDILGFVNEIIQQFQNELDDFNFSLSKEFSSSLYICAVISTTLYYYNQHKTHFCNVLKDIREQRSKFIDKYIPWIVLVENDDENIAQNIVTELVQVFVREIFETEVKRIVEDGENEEKKTMIRSSIIRELDSEVNHASDDWLMRYILEPQQLIIERFEQKWLKLKTTKFNEKLKKIVEDLSLRRIEIFRFINAVNISLQEHGGHSLTFVNDLFKLKDNHSSEKLSDKKFCMAQLFYRCLIGEPVSTEISNQTGSIYTIDDRWKNLVENHFPKPNDEIKRIFRLIENVFSTATISYLGLFLDKILSQQTTVEQMLTDQMDLFVSKTYSNVHDLLRKQVEGCGQQCPCCKRICDVDHHLNVLSPIGQRENRHCCQTGHQIRGMGGMRYEITNEASMTWCEIINDDDPITTNNNIRQTWKTFKTTNANWNFGDSSIGQSLVTKYVSIWKRIGKKLCEHFGNRIKYVEKNSPSIINHFIFILDHSGSMNEKPNSSVLYTPWEHLIQAVQAFLDIRIRQVSFSDRITAIVFGNRAERIYNFENLRNINIELLKMPMATCGGGTHYSSAFLMTIKTLEEMNNREERHRCRQTIIFMTDGEPQDNSTEQLKKLCEWREGISQDSRDKSLINNFWTMALGKFNKRVVADINQKMDGKLVDIARPEDLLEAYAQAAEIL